MSKLITLITITFLASNVLYSKGWQSEVDSLENELKVAQTDSARIAIYFDLHSSLSLNDPEKAVHYANKAREIAEELQDSSLIVRALLNQCDFYNQIGDYTSSLEAAYKALKIAKGNYALLNNCHNRIATAHAGMENIRETLFHNRKALYYSSLAEDSAQIISNIHNIGVTYNSMEKYDSALYYLELTNDYSLRNFNMPDPYALSNIGIVYSGLGKYDSALIFHFEAYKYDSLNYQSYLLGIDEQYIADTYYEMKNFSQAKKFARKSLDRAYQFEALELALGNYELLYEIYSAEGNYKKAFDHALNYAKTADSLSEQESKSIIHGLEAKYKFEEQENRISLIDRQRKLFVRLTIVSILFVFSLLIIVLLAYRRHQANKILMKKLHQANDSKARLLSIISHDLRGSVGTLRTAARAISEGMTDLEDTRSLLESFYPVADSTYDLLENLLTWAKCSSEQLEPDISEVNLHELLEKGKEHTQHFAMSKQVTIINEIPENITVNVDRNMLLSVMRNLLTNSIKFSHPKSEVLVKSDIVGPQIVTSVTDTGVGIEPEAMQKLFLTPEEVQATGTLGERGSGLGIAICKSFLESHNGKIWAKSEPGGGSTFFFSLPVKK